MYIMPQLKNKKNKLRYVEQYHACNIIHFFALNEKRICLFYLFLFFSVTGQIICKNVVFSQN